MRSVTLYRVNAVILFVLLTVATLFYFRAFLVPLFFAIIISMLMLPVSNKLENRGVSRVWATLLCILLFLLVLSGIFWVLAAQAANMSEDLPQIQLKLMQYVQQTQQWIDQKFGVAPQEQLRFVEEQITKLSESANQYFTSLMGGLFGLVASFILTLLYMFFLMWQREKYATFILKLVSEQNRREAKITLHQITQVSAQYLAGRFISMFFLMVFYGIGLSVVGLKNAILVSVIAVLPTIIPYVGAYIGAIFPLIMALISGTSGSLFPTIGVLVVAQVIDNNLIEPFAMGTKLNLNPLFTILAIVVGEMLWGIPGMILFEPMFAIMRIVTQHVPALDPFAYVLKGDESESEWATTLAGKVKEFFKRS